MSYLTEEEAIDAERNGNEYIDFSGNDTCEDWDMEDRRCECGNRRVTWTTQQLDDGTWIAYAEAW